MPERLLDEDDPMWAKACRGRVGLRTRIRYPEAFGADVDLDALHQSWEDILRAYARVGALPPPSLVPPSYYREVEEVPDAWRDEWPTEPPPRSLAYLAAEWWRR